MNRLLISNEYKTLYIVFILKIVFQASMLYIPYNMYIVYGRMVQPMTLEAFYLAHPPLENILCSIYLYYRHSNRI